MVRRLLPLLALALVGTGCGSDEAKVNSQKEGSLTPEARIKQIQDTPGMPDAEKQRVIEQIRHPNGTGSK